jgi:hypothetical protein
VATLLMTAPQNDTIRAVVLAHLKQPIPIELRTYQEIRDWIENTIEPKGTKKPKVVGANVEVGPTAANAANRVLVRIRGTQRAFGTCTYHEDLEGNGDYRISREDLRSLATDAEDADDFWANLRDSMNDWDEHIDATTVENSIAYDNHEHDRTEDSDVEIANDGERAVMDALREIDPEEYSRLFEE